MRKYSPQHVFIRRLDNIESLGKSTEKQIGFLTEKIWMFVLSTVPFIIPDFRGWRTFHKMQFLHLLQTVFPYSKNVIYKKPDSKVVLLLTNSCYCWLWISKKFRKCIYQMVFVSVFYKLKICEYSIETIWLFHIQNSIYQNGFQSVHS